MARPKLTTEAGRIHEEDAAKATGYSCERLYQLAQAGKIGPRVDGCYSTADLLAGICAYFREQQDKRTDNLGQVKLEREKQRLRAETVKADEAEAKVVNTKEAEAKIGPYLLEMMNQLWKIPGGIARMCAMQEPDFIADKMTNGLKGAFQDLPRMAMIDAESKKKMMDLLA